MILNFGAKLIKFREIKDSYAQKVINVAGFLWKYYIMPLESPLFVHIFPTKAIFSTRMLKRQWSSPHLILHPQERTTKWRKWKFPLFSMLRYVKQMFYLRVFEIFVSSLFLLVVFAFGECWLSAHYNQSAVSQEEDHDIKFTGNYTMRGWLLQPPPHRMYLCLLVEWLY